MMNLLAVPDQDLTADRIVEAMALRDEYFSNQYHKIWLVGSQISILLYCSGLGLLQLIPLVVTSSQQLESSMTPWGYQMVGGVLFFGLLGAAFSAAGSLMNTDVVARIPERVANRVCNHRTCTLRIWHRPGGLRFFYQSKILDLHFGNESGPGGALTIAFLFGFAGERLIAQVLGSIGSRQGEGRK